jgi:hypothetical protein
MADGIKNECSNCAALNQADMTCHLQPPTVLLRAPTGGEVTATMTSEWPQVAASDWCGQWRPATELGPKRTAASRAGGLRD